LAGCGDFIDVVDGVDNPVTGVNAVNVIISSDHIGLVPLQSGYAVHPQNSPFADFLRRMGWAAIWDFNMLYRRASGFVISGRIS